MELELIKKLRDMTGAGISECADVIDESGGNIAKALVLLRERGKLKVAKRESRATHEGLITSYVHQTGRVGVLLELRSESDFVARTKEFGELAHELCMQIAAMNPRQDHHSENDDERTPLLNQYYIRDEQRTIRELIAEYSAKFGEKIEVARFARFEL